jgi:chorismate synthase
MNSFGRIFRVNIFGESHGESVGINIDGIPAGLPLTAEDFLEDIERRKGGTQKGTTPRQESDMPIFKSGVFNGKTTGAPLTILFENNNTRSGDYQKQRAVPRPGHADFVASKKFGGFEDYRGGGHFSGRLTVCVVAAGVIAKKLLTLVPNPSPEADKGVEVKASILEIGGETNLETGLQKAIDAKDTIGGIVECRVKGLPIGLGEPFFDSVESLLAHAIFAIPAIRAVEFGTGFAAARMFGTEHNDAIENMNGKTVTNHAGGVVGGITNGNELVLRIAVKPTSSTPKDQFTLNWETGNMETFSVKGRHDLCIALRVPVVLEAITAIVLTDLMMLEQRIPRIVHNNQREIQVSPGHKIYHITTLMQWEEAKENGFYEATSLHTDGFIHCSEKHQVEDVLKRYFTGEGPLVKLTIDSEKLNSRLQNDFSISLNEYFPHIYGRLNLDAVIKEENI